MYWIYKGEVVPEDEVSDRHFGFIYKIEYKGLDGDIYTYYGRKEFFSYITLTALKNGNKRDNHLKFFNKNKNGKRTKMEMLRKESDWRTYNGSCKDVPQGLEIVSKEILKLCKTKTDLTHWENYYLYTNLVLFNSKCLNRNIGGKIFCGEQLTGSKDY